MATDTRSKRGSAPIADPSTALGAAVGDGVILAYRERGQGEPVVFVHDCTRLRVLRIYNRLNQKTAIQFVDCGAD